MIRNHIVAKGETFSSICKIYGIISYQALMKFNSMQDERQLQAGQKILIPRTRLDYEITISKLQHLKNDMLAMVTSQSKQLDLAKQEFELVNTAIDTLSTFLTFKVKVIGAGFEAAKTTGGLIKGTPMVKKAIEEIAELAIDKAIEHGIEKNIKNESNRDFANKVYEVNKEKWKLALKFANEGLKLIDVAESILSLVDPSTIANAYTTWAAGGESAEDSEANARNMIRDTKRKINDSLRDKIDRLINERRSFYGI